MTQTNFLMMPYRTLVVHEHGNLNATLTPPRHKDLEPRDLCYHDGKMLITYFDANGAFGYVALGQNGFETLRQLPRGTRLLSNGKHLYKEQIERIVLGVPVRQTDRHAFYFQTGPCENFGLNRLNRNTFQLDTFPVSGVLYLDDTLVAHRTPENQGGPHWVNAEDLSTSPLIELCSPIDIPRTARYTTTPRVSHPQELSQILAQNDTHKVIRIGHEIPKTLGDTIRAMEAEQKAKARKRTR